MKLAGSADMRRLDQEAVEVHGLPVSRLMEAAGAAAARELERAFGPVRGKTVGVVCGKGNNGGDGLVAARRLKARRARVLAVLAGDPAGLRGEPAVQLDRARRAGVSLLSVSDRLSLQAALEALGRCDVLVDALFGTGLDRPVEGLPLELIRGMNRLEKPVLAVDLPSGLSADTGAPLPEAVRARWTVTFGLPKKGLCTPVGARHAGEWTVDPIGFPEALLRAPFLTASLTEPQEIAAWVPPFPEDVHKGSRGRVLVVGGGPGMSGAPALAALACLRCGAGYVTVACPKRVHDLLEIRVTEAVTAALPETDEGFLASSAAERILELSKSADAVVVGPGIGWAGETAALLREILPALTLPLVVDADGLYHLSGNPELLGGRKVPAVLTPHPGEAARLAGRTVLEIEGDRLRVAGDLASRYNSVVLLKGRYTAVAEPGGALRVNPTGSRALATAGSGDVLSGIVGALLARGLAPFSAAAASAYLHGLAGEEAEREIGPDGVLAGDLLPRIPAALRGLRNPERKASWLPPATSPPSGTRSSGSSMSGSRNFSSTSKPRALRKKPSTT